MIAIHHGDCLDWLAAYDGPLFDSCVTDPPYHLASIVKRFGKPGSAPAKAGATGAYERASRGFMGKEWDGGDIAFRPETWRAVYDKLKPGAHLVAFGGTRTFHRMACAIEDAGFEIRDMLAWTYGQGFPKGLDVGKAIDKAKGAVREITPSSLLQGGSDMSRVSQNRRCDLCGKARSSGNPCICPRDTGPASAEAAQWDGWNIALKPALEPICLARKPLSEKSIAANVLRWGTGALNIDMCRIDAGGDNLGVKLAPSKGWKNTSKFVGSVNENWKKGRYPANLILGMNDDEYELREDILPAQRHEIMGWLHENA